MKIFILVATFIAVQYTAHAQSLTLLTFESYTFADQFQSYYGYGKVESGFSWGTGLEFGLDEYRAVELIYQNFKADAWYDESYTNRDFGSITTNYILLGGTQYAPINDVVSGFGTFNMGMAILHPTSELYYEDITRFAIGGRLGFRFAPGERLSLRIHAQLMSPTQWFGGGFYYGTGGGGAGVSTGSTIFQFNLGGSVNIRLR